MVSEASRPLLWDVVNRRDRCSENQRVCYTLNTIEHGANANFIHNQIYLKVPLFSKRCAITIAITYTLNLMEYPIPRGVFSDTN